MTTPTITQLSRPTIRTNTRGQTAEEILAENIESGMARAGGILRKVLDDTPEDSLVAAKAIKVHPHIERRGDSLDVQVVASVGSDARWSLHPNALRQVCQYTGLPYRYATDLRDPEHGSVRQPFDVMRRAKLLAHNASELLAMSEDRRLVRHTRGEARAFLSDRYRRVDSRQVIEMFAEAIGTVGAKPIGGHASDTRYSIRALMPRIYTPVPNEAIALGVELRNSDFGCGSMAISMFVHRLWCLNGCTMQDHLRQVHRGKRLTEDFQFSEETYRLDTDANVSAMRDAIGHVLSDDNMQKTCDAITALDERQVSWATAKRALAKKLLKSELQAVEAAFESDDIVNLPAGQSRWRLSNALSWVAHSVDADRALELQREAGAILDRAA